MPTRTCPSCGAPDYGSPFCVSCQKPFPIAETAAMTDKEGPDLPVAEIRAAGFLRRFWALFIDWVVFSLVAKVVLFSYQAGLGEGQGVVSMDTIVGVTIVIALLYFTVLTGDGGQTLGKGLLGIKVMRNGGGKVTYDRAFARSLGYLLSIFFGTFLGFLWALWDRKKQAWHDKIAGTRVIKI